MERENRKRGRDDDNDEQDEKNTNGEKKMTTTDAKKQYLNNNNNNNDNHKVKAKVKVKDGDDLGVFDFPWLKEGMMISKSEDDWKSEDTFSSSLEDMITCATTTPMFMHCMCAAEKLEDNDTLRLKEEEEEGDAAATVEGVDYYSIWSSLLTQPRPRDSLINDGAGAIKLPH